MTGKLSRLGALSGIAFAALLTVVRVVEGGGLPSAGDSTASVVHYWTSHRSSQMAVAVIVSFAAVCLVWFGGMLRSVLARAAGGQGTLADLTFGGVLLTAAGMLTISTVEFDAADSAGRVPAQVTQTLSVLQADTYLGVAAGFAILGLAAGAAILRTGVLSRRLGWLSVGAGVLWLTPGEFVAIFLSVLFVAIASISIHGAQSRSSAARPGVATRAEA